MKKKILIDVDSVIPYFTKGCVSGVGRSTLELIKALNEIGDMPFKVVLYSQNIKGIGAKSLKTKFQNLHFYIPRRKPFTNIINYLGLKHLFSQYTLMHIPHNTDKWEDVRATIYTIHDLIVYRYPEMWGLTDEERMEHNYIARHCKAIVTCSESSRQDIINFWKCDPSKVTAIPWGVNRHIFSPDLSSIQDIPYLSKDFFFSSSCNHPRKQASLMLKAFKEYMDRGGRNQLVLLGPKESEIIPYNDLIEKKKLIIIRNISDATLVRLYSQAKATIVVSLYEGFGLPVLESLACHTQVICAKNSSLIEAGGENVDYLEKLDEECLTKKMLSYDRKAKEQTLDAEKIEKHLGEFTWEKCAKKYIDFYTKVLNTM